MMEVITHPNQTYMFEDEVKEAMQVAEEVGVIEPEMIDSITFENSHLVAKYLTVKKPEVAEALYRELEAQKYFLDIEKAGNLYG